MEKVHRKGGGSDACLQLLFQYLHQLIQHYVSPAISISTTTSSASELQMIQCSDSNSAIQLKIEFSQHLLKILGYLSDAQAMIRTSTEENQKKTKDMVTVISELQKTLSEQQEEIHRLESAVKNQELLVESLQKRLDDRSLRIEVRRTKHALTLPDSP